MTSILTISLPDNMKEFIKREGLSPSKMLQRAIETEMAIQNGELLESNASLQAKVSRLMTIIDGYVNFMREKGLQDEFLAH